MRATYPAYVIVFDLIILLISELKRQNLEDVFIQTSYGCICSLQELANSLESASGKLYSLKCDVSKESDVREAFKWVKSNLGGINILVNNAGVCDFNTLTGR